jgi:Cu/Zn superoxide dismutase
VIGLALVAVLAFAACDDDGGDDGVSQLTVTLSEADGSGVTGSATLTKADTGTQVVTTMAGLPEGPHANHLHHGSCDAQGAIHVTLEELQADADGDAKATTTDFADADPDPELDHFEAGHYLAVHEGGDDTVGAVISCGNVEA